MGVHVHISQTDGPPLAIQVAIQGELGSNSHLAALHVLGDQPASILSCAQSPRVFERLADGSAQLAVLPIENSLHGSVFEHFDLLLESSAHVVGESMLRIRHNLIAAPGVPLARITRVLSHPVALSQCRRWLRLHPHLEAVPSYDTAGSVKQLMASGLEDTAAIAPALAATQYDAAVLVPGIEDHHENYTRFFLLRQSASPLHQSASDVLYAGPIDKATLAFSLEHRPGSLIAALEVLQLAELNLTKIESRPVAGKPWEYIFFIDVTFTQAHQLDQAVAALRKRCQMVRELGRYRSAKP